MRPSVLLIAAFAPLASVVEVKVSDTPPTVTTVLVAVLALADDVCRACTWSPATTVPAVVTKLPPLIE